MKSYKEFIKGFIKGSNAIDSICKRYYIKNYTINNDRSIDVDGNVNLNYSDLSKIPLKFRTVSGYFDCSGNKLTTLEGSPQSVGGYFYCSDNQLTTLEGSPQTVGGDFFCYNSKLTTLEGAPKTVGGDFWCQYNQLTTLEGCTKEIGRHFFCHNNQLTTLQGGPETIGGHFGCNSNQLINFNGFPEDFEGHVSLISNPVEEIYDLFDGIKCIKWLNEFDVIQGNKVIMDRLEEVYHQLGIEVPKNIKLDNYEIV